MGSSSSVVVLGPAVVRLAIGPDRGAGSRPALHLAPGKVRQGVGREGGESRGRGHGSGGHSRPGSTSDSEAAKTGSVVDSAASHAVLSQISTRVLTPTTTTSRSSPA